MRLIDADAVKAVFEEKSSEAVCGVKLCKAIISRIDEAPTIDAVPFERFRLVCKFYAVAYRDDYRGTELTCRKKDMIPEGDSWGICDKEHCPYMKVDE